MRQLGVVLVCVAGFYSVVVPLRLVQHDPTWFVHIGKQFVVAGHSSKAISGLHWDGPIGYDGQYYFGLAADPAHARDYMGIESGIVYSRVGYPALIYATSGGSVSAMPYAMLAINLLAVLVGTFAVGRWLMRRGLPPWPAALYGLFPGLIFCVFRDLTEPLAYALVAIAVLLFDRSLWASAAVLALAALTRETAVPFALGGAACLLLGSRRDWRRAVGFAAVSCLPLLLWRIVAGAYTDKPTQEVDHTGRWLAPFHGFFPGWPFDSQHRVIFITVIGPAMLAAIGAIVQLKHRRGRIAALVLLANVLLYVVFLPRGVYIDYAAASRAAIGVVLAALYCLPAWWRQGLVPRLLVSADMIGFSLLWFLFVAWKYTFSSIGLITT
ncbi:MAG TPA: hypothetical protein VF091_07020 [Gaiellaceae bacterium]